MINNKGKSFVTIMIVIAICAVVFRIVIDRVIKISIAQNESIAEGTLKLISAALENFARDNNGIYPSNFATLTKPVPPYLNRNYISLSSLRGYVYSCPRLESAGYSCFAIPSICKLTGENVFNVTTGGAITSEECNKKE